jgi:hypothetical protein
VDARGIGEQLSFEAIAQRSLRRLVSNDKNQLLKRCSLICSLTHGTRAILRARWKLRLVLEGFRKPYTPVRNVSRVTLNQRVVGSSPTRLTSETSHLEALECNVQGFIIVKLKNL